MVNTSHDFVFEEIPLDYFIDVEIFEVNDFGKNWAEVFCLKISLDTFKLFQTCEIKMFH